MLLDGVKVGIGITGSFCTLDKIMEEIGRMIDEGADVYPVLSFNVSNLDTRFGKAEDWKKEIENITGKTAVSTIQDAEPIGPKGFLDIFAIAPCTGNTLAKIANGITDTPVCMAWKAHLRNNKPALVGISTNDGISANGKNLGLLMNMKNVYFVPFGQDDAVKKQNSIISKYDLLIPSILEALQGRQIQPVIV